MESDHGKLFIGGISWDTDEDRLREYFSNFGEVVEVVIMKDRNTGRARGFGFIVFVDPAVAERVVMEKHMIDGRMVEAKKAVPREDQNFLNRNHSSVHSSPLPVLTKKIFVGGLPSTITVADFKSYFLQFGPISDAMVMYDHNTQRPRGFGFITFELEDSVDKVLLNTFHELNGKMVEVKRAVPKELSPGPTMRLPAVGYNYGVGMNRINSFVNGYSQAFSPASLGGYNMKMDARLNTVPSGRNGFPAISPGYGMGLNFEPGFNSSFGVNSNYDSCVGYGRPLGSYYNGNSSRFNSPVGYGGGNVGAGAGITSMSRNVWSNGGLNYLTNSANSNTYMTPGNGTLGGFGNGSLNLGVSSSSFISAHAGGSNAGYATGNLGFGSGENTFSIGGSSFGRNSAVGASASPNAPSDGYEGTYPGLYGSSSVYGDPTWQSESNELDGSGSLSHGFDGAVSELTTKGAAGYMSNYGFASRQQNRGIAA